MRKFKLEFPARLKKIRPRVPRYFRESFAEIKKVTWPTRKEAWKLTLAVFIFSAFFTVLTVIVDIIFKLIAERLFL